jgi:hypothetical protein
MINGEEAVVRAELSTVCAAFGKAESARRLLTYLVECHLRDKVPKETDIAIDVFQRDASFDGSHDAVVRVAVRALRQKLDEYYRDAGRDRPLRFELPRGAYRIHLVPVENTSTAIENADATVADTPADSTEEQQQRTDTSATPAPRSDRTWAFIGLAAALVASVVLNLWLWGSANEPEQVTPHVAHTDPIWAPLLGGNRPLTVVLGDHLLFPNPDPMPGRVQLIRDARVNTEEQLRAFLKLFPERRSGGGPGVQVPTTLVPKSVALGLVDILPIMRTLERQVDVRILDEWLPDELHTHDIVFMGPLVRIGPLMSGVLFRGSRYIFEHDERSRRLRDLMTDTEFQPSPGRLENAIDYGLIASFRGPTGNRVMVFASVGGDLGLAPLIRRATTNAGLEELRALLTENGTQPFPEEFEALIEVSGYHRTDLAAKWIAAHARPLLLADDATVSAAAK